MTERLLEKLDRLAKEANIKEITPEIRNLALLVREDLVAQWPQPAQQEPVAHFGSAYINENGVHVTTVLGPVAIPQDAKLYTSPPAQRKPLTRDQVKAMMVENGYDQASPQERAGFINGIRHGEAAHNIKENT